MLATEKHKKYQKKEPACKCFCPDIIVLYIKIKVRLPISKYIYVYEHCFFLSLKDFLILLNKVFFGCIYSAGSGS